MISLDAYNFLTNIYLPKFTWVALSHKEIDSRNLKSFVDECIGLEKLKLVCKLWYKVIENFFEVHYGVTSWRTLRVCSEKHLYDFSSLPNKRHTLLTVVREFLYAWIGSSTQIEGCSIFQRRPDLEYDGGRRYDCYTARELSVEVMDPGCSRDIFHRMANLPELRMTFEFVAIGYPDTRGQLCDSYDVDIIEESYCTRGKGSRCWTKIRKASQKLDMKGFLKLTNYPCRMLYPDSGAEGDWDYPKNLSDPLDATPEFSIRYDASPAYKHHIENAIVTFLCISRYSEDCWIYFLPEELIRMIVNIVTDETPLCKIYEWQNGQVSKHKYRDVDNDPWRHMLH